MGPSLLAATVALPFAFERAQSRLLLGKQLLDRGPFRGIGFRRE
jgi:hypothetical protein